jgi:hypothetical protein
MRVRTTGARSIRMTRAKPAALETVQTLSETARDVLFACAMTGSAVTSLTITAASHLERCCCAVSSMTVDKRAQGA